MAFSLMTVCVKHLNGRIPVAEIVFARALISLLITHLMIQKLRISPWGNNKSLLFIRGILGTAALFCIFKAIEILPLASATVIQYTYPTFTAIAAYFFLKEKLKKYIIIAIIIGLLGVTLVVNPSWINNANNISFEYKGALIGLAGSLLTALAYICVRMLSKKEHSLVIIYYFPLVSLPFTIPFIVTNAVMPIGIEWLWMIGIGFFTQLGQLFITEGLKLLPAAQASAINYAQVLFATFWGVIIFSESISIWMIIGGMCVFIATIISFHSTQKVSSIG